MMIIIILLYFMIGTDLARAINVEYPAIIIFFCPVVILMEIVWEIIDCLKKMMNSD